MKNSTFFIVDKILGHPRMWPDSIRIAKERLCVSGEEEMSEVTAMQ
jgi:hypothetical protein